MPGPILYILFENIIRIDKGHLIIMFDIIYMMYICSKLVYS